VNRYGPLRQVSAAVAPACHARSCRKEACSLHLDRNLRPFLLIDLDAPGSPAEPDRKRCDFLFFGGRADGILHVAPIELKSGHPIAAEVVPQLQAGADIADRLVPEAANTSFRPVVGYGGELRKVQTRRFSNPANWIRYRGRKVLPRLVQCGHALGGASR